jgi:hypothetical protein
MISTVVLLIAYWIIDWLKNKVSKALEPQMSEMISNNLRHPPIDKPISMN